MERADGRFWGPEWRVCVASEGLRKFMNNEAAQLIGDDEKGGWNGSKAHGKESRMPDRSLKVPFTQKEPLL